MVSRTDFYVDSTSLTAVSAQNVSISYYLCLCCIMQETGTLFLNAGPTSSQPEVELWKLTLSELKISTQTSDVLKHKPV